MGAEHAGRAERPGAEVVAGAAGGRAPGRGGGRWLGAKALLRLRVGVIECARRAIGCRRVRRGRGCVDVVDGLRRNHPELARRLDDRFRCDDNVATSARSRSYFSSSVRCCSVRWSMANACCTASTWNATRTNKRERSEQRRRPHREPRAALRRRAVAATLQVTGARARCSLGNPCGSTGAAECIGCGHQPSSARSMGTRSTARRRALSARGFVAISSAVGRRRPAGQGPDERRTARRFDRELRRHRGGLVVVTGPARERLLHDPVLERVVREHEHAPLRTRAGAPTRRARPRGSGARG